MKAFAELLDRLVYMPSRNGKLRIDGRTTSRPRRTPIAAGPWRR